MVPLSTSLFSHLLNPPIYPNHNSTVTFVHPGDRPIKKPGLRQPPGLFWNTFKSFSDQMYNFCRATNYRFGEIEFGDPLPNFRVIPCVIQFRFDPQPRKKKN
jgi:hypothetical protein